MGSDLHQLTAWPVVPLDKYIPAIDLSPSCIVPEAGSLTHASFELYIRLGVPPELQDIRVSVAADTLKKPH